MIKGEHSPFQASIKILPLDREERCQRGKEKFVFFHFFLVIKCLLFGVFRLMLPCVGVAGPLEAATGVVGAQRPAGLRLQQAQATLRLFL